MVWQPHGSGLAGRLRRAAGNKLHNAVLRRNGNHVGDISPGTVEQTGRDVVFLPDRADLATVFASHMPDDLDVLLARFGRGDRDLSVEKEIGLGLRVASKCEILLLQQLGDRPGQRLSAVTRRAELRFGASRLTSSSMRLSFAG